MGDPISAAVDSTPRRTDGAEDAPVAISDDLLRRLGTVAVATLSAQLRRRGLDNVSIDGVHPLRPGMRFAGRARTLRYLPMREDLFTSHGGGYNAQKRAIDAVGPNEVLVMEARGVTSSGTIGDILALRAKVRGAAAIVTDGGVRDATAVAALDFPVFAMTTHPAVLGRRHVPWDIDVAISCGDTTVLPGDVVVGDDDGVLVIPPGLVEEVLEAAVEQERQETFIAEQVAAGAAIEGLYPLGPDWTDAYAKWCAARDGSAT